MAGHLSAGELVGMEAKRAGRADVVEAFAYAGLADCAIPDWERFGGAGDDPAVAAPPENDSHPILAAQFEQRLAEETRRSFEAGRTQGIEEGRAQERAAQGTAQQQLAVQLDHLLTAFSQER